MLYNTLLFVHVMLLVFWLGGDLGVFILGQQSRRVATYTVPERLSLLKVLFMVDMGPRTCSALMVPVSLFVLYLGGWWPVPIWMLGVALLIGATLLFTGWTGFLNHGTAKASVCKKIEFWLYLGLTIFFFLLGVSWLSNSDAAQPNWLASKAIIYSCIFALSILIDIAYRPVGPALSAIVEKGSSPEREAVLLGIMNRTRKWVLLMYSGLAVMAYLGIVKPF